MSINAMNSAQPESRDDSGGPGGPRRGGVAFLLAQLGADAADRFAALLRQYELTPPLAGMLRILAGEPGCSQQALAERLGMVPSRVVTFVDDLESRGWVRRERDAADRRVNVLTVTDEGREALRRIGKVGAEHERIVTSDLTAEERETLYHLLSKLAESLGLEPGVHPGFRKLTGR